MMRPPKHLSCVEATHLHVWQVHAVLRVHVQAQSMQEESLSVVVFIIKKIFLRRTCNRLTLIICLKSGAPAARGRQSLA